MNASDPPHWTLNCHFGAFRTIWVHSGLFGCLTKLGAKLAELVQKFVPRSRIGIFRKNAPDPPCWTLNLRFGVFRTIWVGIWLPYETRCKTGRTSAKVRATKSHRNFSQRTYQVHPIRTQTDVLVRFILFGCILERLVSLRNSVQNGPN